MDLSPDAPHSPDRTRRAAELAAEAVRLCNHATRAGSGGLTHPADADAVTASVAVLVARLPQLFSQIAIWLEGEQAVARLTVVSGPFEGRPRFAVEGVRAMLDSAAEIAGDLHTALNHAHVITAAIAGGPEDS